MTTSTTTTHTTLDAAIATVTTWLRARAHMTALELAREAGVLLLTSAAVDDDEPFFTYVGPLDLHVFPHAREAVMVHLGAHAPASGMVRRRIVEGLACILVERETRQRIGRTGYAHALVAASVPLPRAPRASERAWWRESLASAQARRAETDRLATRAA